MHWASPRPSRANTPSSPPSSVPTPLGVNWKHNSACEAAKIRLISPSPSPKRHPAQKNTTGRTRIIACTPRNRAKTTRTAPPSSATTRLTCFSIFPVRHARRAKKRWNGPSRASPRTIRRRGHHSRDIASHRATNSPRMAAATVSSITPAQKCAPDSSTSRKATQAMTVPAAKTKAKLVISTYLLSRTVPATSP